MIFKRKKVIGIDINEVLRSIVPQFDYFYEKEFGELSKSEDMKKYDYNFLENYNWKDGEEKIKLLKDDAPEISTIDYALDSNNEYKVDDFLFKEEVKNVTKKTSLEKFLYEDYVYEIFGCADNVDKINTINDLNEFIKLFWDKYDIVIVSDEETDSISSTLFYLAKLRVRFRNYKFVKNYEDKLKGVDYLITSDVRLLSKKRKKIIMYNRYFNINFKINYKNKNINRLPELKNIL